MNMYVGNVFFMYWHFIFSIKFFELNLIFFLSPALALEGPADLLTMKLS